MGFRFRRSVRVLPGIRLNLSGSGASVSLGPRGLHYTIGPKGTRVTASIPGTGLSWTQYTPHARRPPPKPRLPTSPTIDAVRSRQPSSETPFIQIQSEPAEEINALSTSELAPILESAHRRIPILPITLVICVGFLFLAVISKSPDAFGFSVIYASVFIFTCVYLDRYRHSIGVVYDFDESSKLISNAIADSFADLRSCNATWSIQAVAQTTDWKRNAGATQLNKRTRIVLRSNRPSCIRGPTTFPAIRLGSDELFLLPDAALLVTRNAVAALRYQDLLVSVRAISFIEDEAVPRDADVVGETWKFVNKNGDPDKRFNYNKRLSVCRYGEMDFRSDGGLNGRIHFSNSSAGDNLSGVLTVLRQMQPDSLSKSITRFRDASHWPTLLFFLCLLLFGAPIAVISYSSEIFHPSEIIQTENRVETIRFIQSPTEPPQSANSAKRPNPTGRPALALLAAEAAPASAISMSPAAQPRTPIPLPRPRPRLKQ
jgi:hypothetical protein